MSVENPAAGPLVLVGLVAAFVFLVLIPYSLWSHRRALRAVWEERDRLANELEYLKGMRQVLTGYNPKLGDYTLVSLDGGYEWYHAERWVHTARVCTPDARYPPLSRLRPADAGEVELVRSWARLEKALPFALCDSTRESLESLLNEACLRWATPPGQAPTPDAPPQEAP